MATGSRGPDVHSRLESEAAEATRRRLIPARSAGQGSGRHRRARRSRRTCPARGMALAAGRDRCWTAGKVRHVTGSSCQGPRLGRVGGAFCRFATRALREVSARPRGRQAALPHRVAKRPLQCCSCVASGCRSNPRRRSRGAQRSSAARACKGAGGCQRASCAAGCPPMRAVERRRAQGVALRATALVRHYIPRVAGVSIEPIRRALRHFIICTPAQQPPM